MAWSFMEPALLEVLSHGLDSFGRAEQVLPLLRIYSSVHHV